VDIHNAWFGVSPPEQRTLPPVSAVCPRLLLSLPPLSRSVAPVWKGWISFGLVNIPVRLHPAVQSGNGEIHFRQLHRTDLAPIRYDRVCTADGKEVAWGDIVKGYEYAKGKYIALSDAELKAAELESSKSIEMLDFVKEQQIDPRFFDTPYYLLPDKGGDKAYALLREAMHATGMAGIGKFTLRQKQQLACVKAVGTALVLEVMRFASHLVDVAEYSFPPATGVRPQELRMAEELIENLAGPFKATKYTDDYRATLMRIIRAKLKGEKIEPEPRTPGEKTKVLDLVARLRESLEQGNQNAVNRARPAQHSKTPKTARRKRARETA
jgi:DNA end-binding protein Ku